MRPPRPTAWLPLTTSRGPRTLGPQVRRRDAVFIRAVLEVGVYRTLGCRAGDRLPVTRTLRDMSQDSPWYPPGTGTEQSRNFLTPRQGRRRPPVGAASTVAEPGQEKSNAALATPPVHPDRPGGSVRNQTGGGDEEDDRSPQGVVRPRGDPRGGGDGSLSAASARPTSRSSSRYMRC